MKVCSKCGEEKPTSEYYPRYAQCKECARAKMREYQKNNRDALRKRALKYREENREKSNASRRAWKQANPEKVKQSNAAYRERNRGAIAESARRRYERDTEKVLAIAKRWKRNNPDRVAAMDANRRAAKLQATPPWLTEEQREQMAAVYREARRLRDIVGGDVHVDHIVPLRGKTAWGLHVPWNLRPLDAVENLRKNNAVPENF